MPDKGYKGAMTQAKKLFLLMILFLISIVSPVSAGGTYHLKVGDTKSFSFIPKNGIRTETIRWTTSRPNEVRITSNIGTSATIEAVKSFTGAQAVVQCRYYYFYYVGSFTYQMEAAEDFYVYVDPLNPTSISIQSSITLNVDSYATLTPSLYPSGAEATLSWESDDYSIASVNSDGRVYANRAGSTYITVSTNNGLTSSCQVTVKEPTLTLKASPSNGLLEKGALVTLTASANNSSIYYTLDGSEPTKKSSLYNAPIVIDRDLTLKAVAYCNGYVQSSVLTSQYTVSALKVASCLPKNNAINIEKNAIPAITFNSSIYESTNFKNINLMMKGSIPVAGEKIISDNTLFFVPDKPLENGSSYKLSVPMNAIETLSKEPNFAYSINFSMINPSIPVVSVGYQYSALVKTDNTLWTWGLNNDGQLGDGTTTLKSCPIKIMDNVTTVASNSHTVAVKTDGTLWTWGSNQYGKLGDGTTTNRSTPVQIMDNVATVASDSHTTAVKTDGTLWTWGSNQYGQLGDGTSTDRKTPVKIMDNVVSVAAGSSKTAAIKTDGTLWAWGHLFVNEITTSQKPVKIMDKVASVSVGWTHTVVIKTDGTLWAWGNNEYGELGDGTTTRRYYPVKIMDKVAFVSAGVAYTAAIRTDGTLWTWGSNQDGKLGDGTTIQRNSPVKIMDKVAFVSTGSGHTAAIKTDGSLWTWGYNGTYELGDGTDINRNSPVKIMDGSTCTLNPVTSITLDKTNIELSTGSKTVLQTIIEPFNSEYELIQWSSDNESVAGISQRGVVTAVAPGSTTISVTANAKNGKSYTASCIVNVVAPSSTAQTLSDPNQLHAWVNDGSLYIKGLSTGKTIRIYNTMGVLLYNEMITEEKLNIPLNESGIYIVQSGDQTVKVVNSN